MGDATVARHHAYLVYAEADRDKARKVITFLRGQQLSVFDWIKDIPWGEAERRGRVAGLRQSRSVVVLLSPAMVQGGWQEFETLVASHDDPANKSRRMLWLQIAGCAVPEDVQPFRHIKMLTDADWEEHLPELAHVLAATGTPAPPSNLLAPQAEGLPGIHTAALPLGQSHPPPASSTPPGGAPPAKARLRVLIVFSNPPTTSLLRLDQEERAIREAIKLSAHRDMFEVTTLRAATVHDLCRALLETPFDLVQFSGHGTSTGLTLEDTGGLDTTVPHEALAEQFRAYAPPQGRLRCVILNACHSASQAAPTSQGVSYTIAMRGRLSDTSALEFSRGFYDALGAGRDIEFAFSEGCRRAKLSAPGGEFVPTLAKASREWDAGPNSPR